MFFFFLMKYIPGHASGSLTKISLHELQTRTGLGHPRPGTARLCNEHALQNPSPQPRQ